MPDRSLTVSVVALPDTGVATMFGVYDVLNSLGLMGIADSAAEDSVEAVGWHVGYEDAAFFRRLFKRVTGLTPGVYRRRYRVPDIARPG